MMKKRKFLFFENIPKDIIIEIICFLDPPNIRKICQVSKEFYGIINNAFWKKYYASHLYELKINNDCDNWKEEFKNHWCYFSFNKTLSRINLFNHNKKAHLTGQYADIGFLHNRKGLERAIYKWKIKVKCLEDFTYSKEIHIGISSLYPMYSGIIDYGMRINEPTDHITVTADFIHNKIKISTKLCVSKFTEIHYEENYLHLGIRSTISVELEIIQGTIKYS